MVVQLQPFFFFFETITELQNFFNAKVGYMLAAVLLLAGDMSIFSFPLEMLFSNFFEPSVLF